MEVVNQFAKFGFFAGFGFVLAIDIYDVRAVIERLVSVIDDGSLDLVQGKSAAEEILFGYEIR